MSPAPQARMAALGRRRRMLAGAATRAALERLLGIEGVEAFGIEAAAWTRTGVTLAIRCGPRRPVIFQLEPKSEGKRGLLETEHLVLHYATGTPARAFAERVGRQGRSRLADETLTSLGALFARDPQVDERGLPAPPAERHPGRLDSLLDTWGDSNAFADFFAVDEIARGQLDSIDPLSLFVFVQHADLECDHVTPHGGAPVVSQVAYPWEHRIRLDRAPQLSLLEGTMLSTDLDERDVIMGNPEKLRQVLDQGVAVANREGKSLFVANTCVPMVTGEDVGSEVGRCAKDCQRSTHYLTISPNSMDTVFEPLLVDRRKIAEARAGERRRASGEAPRLNLLGLHPTPGRDELIALLAAMGVEVNVLLVPELSEERIDALPAADLDVVAVNEAWGLLYEQLGRGSPRPRLIRPAPYGVEGTRAWLAAIADALELGEAAREAAEAALAPHAETFAALRERARGEFLGLCCRAREVRFLLEPEHFWGVPLLPLLEEMGFGLEVAIYFESREEMQVTPELHRSFREPERHRIKGFDSYEGMMARLGEMEAGAVFSHHSLDWRITGSGKNLFSLQHLEVGAAGAVRSLQRLLRIARTPYFRRFGRYLQRDASGRRVGGA
ncbi:MAG: nitrogenase component 1 [Deltaproteobacteria bacterium]|nr:nitrogenase component 1 [Deltaproteobacteria bacterium]